MDLIAREVTKDEWRQIESQRAAQVILGDGPLTPYDLVGAAKETTSLRQQLWGAVDAIEALRSRVRPDDSDEREAAYARGYLAG